MSSGFDRGSADDLRSALPGGLGGPTFVLVTLVYKDRCWATVARSLNRGRLLGLAEVLPPLVSQPFEVIEVACDPEDIEAIELAVAGHPVGSGDGMFDVPWNLDRKFS